MPLTPSNPVNDDRLDSALADLVAGRNRDPFGALGPHRVGEGSGIVIRALQPAARRIEVRVIVDGISSALHAMRPAGYDGLFESVLPLDDVPDYRLRVTYAGDHVLEIDDPYRYGRVLSDFDLYLLGEG